MSKKGFTLAEVLITLAIIGVVAALTIPSVVKNYRAQVLETQLKKAYSTLNQAITRTITEEGVCVTRANFDHLGFRATFPKYLKVQKDCKGNCIKSSDYYRTFSKTGPVGTPLFDDGQIFLTNNMFLMIENPNSTDPSSIMAVSIDINGLEKDPNAFGQDLFTFQLMDNGKFLPMGAEGTKYIDKNLYCSKKSTQPYNGAACAYWALTDKEYFKNLP